jgi:hypothetical protein
MADGMKIRGNEGSACIMGKSAPSGVGLKPDGEASVFLPADNCEISSAISDPAPEPGTSARDEAAPLRDEDPVAPEPVQGKRSNDRDMPSAGGAPIFIENPLSEEERKRSLIEQLMEDKIGEGKREKIQRRLQKYPEKALELLCSNDVKVLDKPLSLLDSLAGGYRPAQRDIQIGRGAYIDFFIDHPRLSSLFAGQYPPAVMGSVKVAAIAAAAAFIALPVSLAAIATGGIALSPLALILLSKVRSRSVKDPLEHETAHALDLALGRAAKNRVPISHSVASDPSIPHYTYEKDCTPFSLKSPEIAECYKACKEGKAKFVTEYAAGLIEEYFAESVRAYLNVEETGSDKCREDLRKKDPAICGFIEKMFDQISSGAYSTL